MPISSNRRQRVIEFATPKVADLVIVERVDSSKNVNAAATAYDSDYGTPHPDATRFPNFKLALIKNSDDDHGQYQDWYYVADRTEQDKYNWEFQAAGGESPRYDTVVRTYVLPRADGGGTGGETHFDEARPLLTSAMPTTTNDPFGASDFSTSGTDASYILFEKKQVRSGDDFLDTLFVVEQRVYVKRVSMRRVDVDDAFPYNARDAADNGSSDDNPPYGGLISKETLYHKDEAIYATIDFIDPSSDTGIQEIDDPSANATRRGIRSSSSSEITAQYVFTNANAVYTITGNNNTHDDTSSNDYTYNFWGVDAFGIMREGKQLSDNWYALVERQVIVPSRTTNQVSKYTTYQNYSWPAVLQNEDGVNEGGVGGGGIDGYTWTRKNGGGDTVIFPRYKRHAYSGPTKVEVTLFWSKEQFSSAGTTDGTDGGNLNLTNVIPMHPVPISFVSPLESLNVGPTLHTEIDVMITTGTDHPVWELAGAQFTYEATNYTDWPDSLIISDTQKPYRGGWLRERIKAFKPEPGPGADSVQTDPGTT